MVDPDDFSLRPTDGRPLFIAGPMYPSLDHITPRSLGGEDTEFNLRTAHMICNTKRATAIGEQLAWAM